MGTTSKCGNQNVRRDTKVGGAGEFRLLERHSTLHPEGPRRPSLRDSDSRLGGSNIYFAFFCGCRTGEQGGPSLSARGDPAGWKCLNLLASCGSLLDGVGGGMLACFSKADWLDAEVCSQACIMTDRVSALEFGEE